MKTEKVIVRKEKHFRPLCMESLLTAINMNIIDCMKIGTKLTESITLAMTSLTDDRVMVLLFFFFSCFSFLPLLVLCIVLSFNRESGSRMESTVKHRRFYLSNEPHTAELYTKQSSYITTHTHTFSEPERELN